MRIPANACEGCNKGYKLYSSGVHCMGAGRYQRCAFVEAEMADVRDAQFKGVFTYKPAALALANKVNGSLVWSGQSRREMWLVVRGAL